MLQQITLLTAKITSYVKTNGANKTTTLYTGNKIQDNNGN